jgi:large subunit ribosomal protein L18
MKNLKPRTVLFRRKRELRTNYKKRLLILVGQKPRVVVRFTNQNIVAQLVSFEPAGDKVLVGVDSRKELKVLGWNYSAKNVPASYLTGLLFAKKALAKGIKEGVLDTGFKQPFKGGKCFAFLKGVVDGGLAVPHDAEVVALAPDRLQGKHIEQYVQQVQGKNKGQFTQYLKTNGAGKDIGKSFESIKQKIGVVAKK